MRTIFFACIVTLTASCSSSSPEQRFTKEDSAAVAGMEKNELAARMRFASLGGVTEIIRKYEKCNLQDGYYVINQQTTDSAAVAFIAAYLADSLFKKPELTPGCSSPVMSSACVYLSIDDYKTDIGGYAAMGRVSPETNLQPDVLVNKQKLAGK